MSKAKVVAASPRKRPKVYNITLTLSDIIWMCAGLAIALTIFFIFGLVVGRGYVPSGPMEVQSPATAPVEVRNQTEPAVLQPEDLDYPEKLNKLPPPIVSDPAGKPVAGPKAARPEANKSVALTPEPAKELKAIQTVPPESVGTRYEYVYQVAAFRKRSMAEDLSGRLTARGLKTEIRPGEAKGSTWYRVHVLFAGAPDQIRSLRKTITEVTKIQPVLVSKVEATRP